MFLKVGGVLLVCGLLNGCYVLQQAWHQNNLYNSRKPIQEVIEDPSTDEFVKERLKLVEQVLSFAARQGLNTEDAYRYYIHTRTNAVSYLVQAAEMDRLKFKTWWFPLVGAVPYLGFFDIAERDKEAKKLEAEGWDVSVGSAAAFSSLGYFEDPIYTSMLRGRESGLAHLIIHELTHRTFWSKGSATFNENLAEYVATKLTPQFLKETGRESSIEPYFAERRDRVLFRTWLKDLRRDLDNLYAKRGQISREELLKQKEVIFSNYTKDKLPSFETDHFDYIAEKRWNNASVLAASLYTPDTERFATAHRCLGEERPVIEFLNALKKAERKAKNAFKALDALCG